MGYERIRAQVTRVFTTAAAGAPFVARCRTGFLTGSIRGGSVGRGRRTPTPVERLSSAAPTHW
jgi:hypothetical protein